MDIIVFFPVFKIKLFRFLTQMCDKDDTTITRKMIRADNRYNVHRAKSSIENFRQRFKKNTHKGYKLIYNLLGNKL